MKSKSLGVVLVMASLFLSSGAAAQSAYHDGRCDGTMLFQGSGDASFSPAGSPLPVYLWMLVVSGTGYVTMTGSSGATGGFYFHTADLLFFSRETLYQLSFLGGSMLIAYGGTSTGASQSPVCSTGALGPVVLLADQHYDVLMQTSTSGVSAKVTAYSTVNSMVSQTLHYLWITGAGAPAIYAVPTCSGSACCNPAQKVFSIAKSGTGGYSVYALASAPSADFDYAKSVPAALSASASATPTSGATPLTVSFAGAGAGGHPPYTWDWDFGDGSSHATTQNPSHTYHTPALFHPVLTVKDSTAQTASDSHLVIDATALTVTASADPAAGNAPLTVAFKGSATGGRSPYTYAWEFGEGGASSDANPSHTYTAAGTYDPSLTVTDADGKSATDSHLTIRVTPPGVLTAIAQADTTAGPVPLTVNFNGSASSGTPPYTYGWDFGDGSQSSNQNPAHTYASQGDFTAALTVQDSAGGSAQDGHLRISAGNTLLAQASGHPLYGNAPLTVAFTSGATGGTPPYTYSWDFGDGTSPSAEQNPSHTYANDGNFSVVLTVTDAVSRTATDSHLVVNVGSQPGAPVIVKVQKATNPFRLKIFGQNFLVGCTVFIGTQAAPQTLYKSAGLVVAKGDTALKAMLPRGVAVCITVRNPDGTQSECWTYIRGG